MFKSDLYIDSNTPRENRTVYKRDLYYPGENRIVSKPDLYTDSNTPRENRIAYKRDLYTD